MVLLYHNNKLGFILKELNAEFMLECDAAHQKTHLSL